MRNSTEQDYHARLLRVLIYIQHHLDEAVSLEDLARIAHFSPFHFHRVFRGMVGESVMEHVRRLRLERAAHLLACSPRSVTAIAFDAGYETLDAFTRAFRGMFGTTPSTYRSQHRAQPFPGPVEQVHYHPQGDLREFTPLTTGAAMDVTLRTYPKMKVAFVRNIGPYAQCEASWNKLCAWAGPRGLLNANSKFIGLSYDDPDVTPPDKLRYDACIVLDRDVAPEGEIGVQDIGGGAYAVIVHVGPYEKLNETYGYLFGQWLPRSGYAAKSEPPFEIYLSDHTKTPPAELRTEICLPVEKA
ncbi:MAG: AraC family transcriptional regulator [Calditrichota bacterium]